MTTGKPKTKTKTKTKPKSKSKSPKTLVKGVTIELGNPDRRIVGQLEDGVVHYQFELFDGAGNVYRNHVKLSEEAIEAVYEISLILHGKLKRAGAS